MTIVVVMGVSGSGKSAVGRRLAQRLGWPFCEGDALHPAANIAKMASGVALDDRDRRPWLDAITRWIDGHRVGVVACSALRRRYRDRLCRGRDLRFVLLDPPRSVLARRLRDRTGHFMPASLLASQLRTLERPSRSNHTLRLTARRSPTALAARIAAWLRA